MGRGNLSPTTPKQRSSLVWFLLLSVPIIILILNLDVLALGNKADLTNAVDDDKLRQPVGVDVTTVVEGEGVKEVSMEERRKVEQDEVVDDDDDDVLEDDADVVINREEQVVTGRKLLVGQDTAPTSRTCDNGQHAVDDNGVCCMPDFKFRLFKSLIFAVDRPDVSYMVCAIPKNGCTYHLALINRIYGETDYEVTGVIHDIERKNNIYKLSARGNEMAAKMLANTSIPKYAVVRNPLQRTMSAYLNKIENFLPESLRTVESFHDWIYREFPKDMPIDRSWDGMNPHWLPQMEFCGFKVRDIHSYFKIFRVEEPKDYVDFIYKYIPEEYLKDGWAKEENLSFRDHVLGPRTRTEGTSEKFLKYFNNLEVFDHMSRVLSKDIEAFGYQDDVKKLREDVKRRIADLSDTEDEDLD